MTVTPDERVSTTPTTVLYVDPDHESLERVTSVLEAEYAMEVMPVASAEAALEHLADRQVDCIVSEVELPGMDGVEFFRSISDHEVSFIFVTDVPPEECLPEIHTAGITDYLQKDEAERRSQWLGMRIATAIADKTRETPTCTDPRVGGSCYLDDELRILRASESFARMYGVDPDELQGEPWSVIHGEDDRNSEAIRSQVDTTGRWTDETVCVRTDDTTFPCRHSLVQLGSERYLYTVTGFSEESQPVVAESVDSVQATVRRRTERRRASSERTALFEACAKRVRNHLDADCVGIFEYQSDDELYVPHAGAGWGDGDETPALPEEVFDPNRSSLTELPVERWDIDTTPALTDVSTLVDRGVVVGFAIPIVDSDSVWGLVGVFSTTQSTYSPSDFEIVRTVSTLLSIAIDHERQATELEAFDNLVDTMLESETKRDVCELAADAIEDVSTLSVLAMYVFDERNDVLRLGASTRNVNGTFPPTKVDGTGDGLIWNAFIQNEPIFVDELSSHLARSVPDPAVADGVLLPLEGHGVVVTGTLKTDRTIGPGIETATAIASLARAALEQIDRTQMLVDQRERLETQSETIDQLTQISDLVRNVDRAIVEASSRAELEDVVCTHLVEYDPIVFAWIGEYDDVTEAVTPNTWAGEEKSYLSGVSIDLDESVETQEPMGVAVKHRETYQRLRLIEDVPPDPWQREALKRGYRSVLSVPIVYREFRYGGITIYSDQPTVLDETERQLFENIGKRLGHACNALEQKNALVDSSGVIVLEFSVRDEQIPFVQWSSKTGCQFECETIISRPDGSIRGFFTVEGASPDQILSLAERSAAVSEASLITEREEISLFQCTLTEDSVAAQVLEYGAVPTMMTAADEEGRIVVELPEETRIREFVSVFQSKYPDSELIRRHHSERHPQTRYEFTTEIENELTDRQLEALRTAYFSGYFETPRENSGKEIATMLDIAQPTLNHHLRTAQRKLFGLLFTDAETDACRSTDRN